MEKLFKLVVFSLKDQRFAIYLNTVDRIIRAVQITQLPNAPEVIIGVINVHGEIIPVVDLRKRLGLRDKDMELYDRIIIAQTKKRIVAILSDTVDGVLETSKDNIIPSKEIMPGLDNVEGIVKLGSDIIFIQDIDKFLSLEEYEKLDRAFENNGKTKKKNRKRQIV